MKTVFLKSFLMLFLISINCFATDLGQLQDIDTGLKLLYKNANCKESKFCLESEKNESTLIQNAIDFKEKLISVLKDKNIENLKRSKIDLTTEEFQFTSPIQRDGMHPANQVYGYIYYPINYNKCAASFPATLLIHKLSVDIESEKQIAKTASLMNKGIVMLIYLPHFGPRQTENERFITKNKEAFELNILQALADVHMSYEILKSLPHVQQNNIGLMGLSLGGMITLISAGIDPIFDRYATNVGGGDLANIVTYRKTGDVDSQTGQALKDIDWSVDQARFELSKFDAITWSLQAKNKKFLMINAIDDELINRKLSIDPLIEGHRLAGSKTEFIVHKGSHVFHAREVGLWSTLTDVMLPMINFIGFNTPSDIECRADSPYTN